MTFKGRRMPPTTSEFMAEQKRQGYDIDVLSFEDSLSRATMFEKGLKKAKKKGNKKYNKFIRSKVKKMEAGVALAVPSGEDKLSEGYIAMSSRSIKNWDWTSFGLLAHETGHIRDFRKNPALNIAYKFPFAKSYIETKANVFAVKQLKRYGAPRNAYVTPILSEASYLGAETVFAGILTAIAGDAIKNRKVMHAGFAVGITGLMLNAFTLSKMKGMVSDKAYAYRSKSKKTNTQGLTNNALHKRKVMHDIKDQHSKNDHLFRT